MDYISAFRDSGLCSALTSALKEEARRSGDIRLMEVCGTHTMAIHRYGIKSLLPGNVKLLSGPGCPVCVTSATDIDRMIACSHKGTVTTFGDMLRVPGSFSSLEKERAKGADVRIVYSPMDGVKIAEKTDRPVIFLGVGFETTAPTVAKAIKSSPANFFVYSAHKVVPPALRALVEGRNRIDGFLLPGHVCTISGTEGYEFLKGYGIPCVVSGFEPADILASLLMLIRQISEGRADIEIEYSRSVRREGNSRAMEVMYEVFEPSSAVWRGLGRIEEFSDRNAGALLEDTEIPEAGEPEGCRCGEVLQGLVEPTDCPLFARACTPNEPIGPCMVSSEGTCAAYYKYGGHP
jgi:hydrogenase expression/formation protein HypD